MLFFRLLSWWCEHCEDKRVWQEMKERSVIKLLGCSWVEINRKDRGIEIKNRTLRDLQKNFEDYSKCATSHH